MLAIVRVDDDPPYMLTLEDDRRWTSDEAPEIASLLTVLQADTYGEWNGQPGAYQADEAAKILGGEVLYPKSDS